MAEEHAESAEKRLDDYEGKCGPTEAAHRAAILCAREPDGENQGENGNSACYHAMCEFVTDSADERWNYFPVGEGPIGDGVCGIVASYERACH
jgi:hypothetical protein